MDGSNDILVSYARPGGCAGDICQSVLLVSGRTGAAIMKLDGGTSFGDALAECGDINYDGYPDLLVSAPGYLGAAMPGSVSIFSGRDGSVLRRHRGLLVDDGFGANVASLPDVNGDSVEDYAIGAPGVAGASGPAAQGYALVFSGRTGSVLFRLDGNRGREDYFGQAIACAGDVNGDGVADIVVGAPQDQAFGNRPGYVRAFSGANGGLLFEVFGSATSYQRSGLGEIVSGLGDIDSDGFDDIVVGTSRELVVVISGRTQAELRTWAGPIGSIFGRSLDGIGDIDGDGVPDVVIGAEHMSVAGMSYAGAAYVYSGGGGGVIASIQGSGQNRFLGSVVGGAGDLTGDGIEDILVYDNGDAYAYSIVPLPLVEDENLVSLVSGGNVSLALEAPSYPNTAYWLLGSASGITPGWSFHGLNIPLNPDSYLVQTALFPNTPPLGNSMGVLDANGQATATIMIPPGLPPALVGLTLDHAFLLYTDPQTFAFASNAVPLTFVP